MSETRCSCEPYSLCAAHRDFEEYLADLDHAIPTWEIGEAELDMLYPSDFPINSHDFEYGN